jgi:hypothetical protein
MQRGETAVGEICTGLKVKKMRMKRRCTNYVFLTGAPVVFSELRIKWGLTWWRKIKSLIVAGTD